MGHGSGRGPVNAPPLIYPQPSATEAERRLSPPILFMAGGLVLIFAAIIGVPYLRTDGWPFGVMVIVAGAFIAGLLWVRFNKRD